MPNVILTDKCNLNCTYCFAGHLRSPSTGRGSDLTFPALHTITDFLLANRVDIFRMIGGEPTLHPEFEKILAIVKPLFEKIGIYTNGLWPEPITEIIAELTGHKLQLLINVNEPGTYGPGQWDTLLKRLDVLRGNPAVGLGINIYHFNYNLDFPIELAVEFGFSAIRYSIARPIAGVTGNAHIPFTQFKSSNMNRRIFKFVSKAWQAGIACYHDCVMPPCFFSNEQLGALAKMGLWYNFSCNAAIDIHPDLTVSRCFALSRFLRVPLKNFKTLPELERFFTVRLAPVSKNYRTLPECSNCTYREKGSCQGGCFSELLQTDEITDPVNIEPQVRYCSCLDLPDKLFESLVPELSPGVKLLSYKTTGKTEDTDLRLINTNTGEFLVIGRSFPFLMKYVDGKTTIAGIVTKFLENKKTGSRYQVFAAMRELFFSGILRQSHGPFFARIKD